MLIHLLCVVWHWQRCGNMWLWPWPSVGVVALALVTLLTSLLGTIDVKTFLTTFYFGHVFYVFNAYFIFQTFFYF